MFQNFINNCLSIIVMYYYKINLLNNLINSLGFINNYVNNLDFIINDYINHYFEMINSINNISNFNLYHHDSILYYKVINIYLKIIPFLIMVNDIMIKHLLIYLNFINNNFIKNYYSNMIIT